MDDTVSIARRIRQLAAECPDELAFRHIALDGGEPALTWTQLDRRSSELGGALATRGLSFGDILGLGLRNSPQFVLSVFAAWKLGAVPVPVRWDVPGWELDRLREVVAPRVYLSPADVPWIDATAGLGVPDLPDVVAPQVNGICSSGSTGTPKVILIERPAVCDPRQAMPYMAMWRPVPRPQTILVLAPMYHINGFSMLNYLLGGDRLVVMEKFDAARVVDVIERYRVSNFTATPSR
jgi:bile acid-coenzyme A ligase